MEAKREHTRTTKAYTSLLGRTWLMFLFSYPLLYIRTCFFFSPSDRDLLADGPVVSRPPTLCTDSPFFQTFIFSQVSRPMVDIAPAGQWRPLFFRATFLLIFVTSPFF